MLREIRNEHLEPMLLGLVVNMQGTHSITVGDDDISSITDGGVGVQTHVFRQTFNRNPIGVATCTTVGANGALPAVDIIDPVAAQVSNVSNAGGGNDGIMHVLYLGWRARTTDLVRGQLIHGSINSPRILAASIVGGTGAVSAGGSDVSCTRTGTGTYTVIFKRAFSKPPVVLLAPNEASATLFPNIVAVTASQVTIACFNQAAAATDCTFELIAYGSGSRDEIGRQKKIVFHTQRKPRLIGFSINVPAGVPAAGVGANDIASIVDNGVGDYTINLARPFRKTPFVITTSGQGSTQTCVRSRTTSAIRIGAYTDAGAASDPAKFYVFALGADDPSEY